MYKYERAPNHSSKTIYSPPGSRVWVLIDLEEADERAVHFVVVSSLRRRSMVDPGVAVVVRFSGQG